MIRVWVFRCLDRLACRDRHEDGGRTAGTHPCQHQLLHADGVAEVPECRISPDRPLAVMTGLWQDHYGGGPLGWTQLLLGARTIPSYLAHD
ncbi:hypothetical protein RHCRD62_20693 [Rhodococcus sp. RD6.2]|nr:hypothetical protein RHCRD62_20693 [Rhodococcus sp. RD6.2]